MAGFLVSLRLNTGCNDPANQPVVRGQRIRVFFRNAGGQSGTCILLESLFVTQIFELLVKRQSKTILQTTGSTSLPLARLSSQVAE